MGGTGRRIGRPLRIETVPQLLSPGEVRDPPPGNVDLLAGLWIAAIARFPNLYGKTAEPADFYPLLALERVQHRLKYRVDDGLDIALRNARCLLADPVDELALGHAFPPLVEGPGHPFDAFWRTEGWTLLPKRISNFNPPRARPLFFDLGGAAQIRLIVQRSLGDPGLEQIELHRRDG